MNFILRLIIGLGLLISGFLHQYNIEIFELRLFELFNVKWTILPFFSRLFVALELYLGLSFAFNINPKKINTYLLALFTAVITYDMIWDVFFNTNHFYLQIKPFYKYIGPSFVYYKIPLTLTLIGFLVYEYKSGKSTDFKFKWIKALFPIAGIAFVFIYNAVFFSDVQLNEAEKKTDVDLVAINDKLLHGFDKLTLDGDVILMFVSVGCPHCFETTKKVAAIKRRRPNLNVELVLFDKNNIDVFQEYANADFPYRLVSGSIFGSVILGSVPRVMHVRDGEIIMQWDGKTFNFAALNYLMNMP